MKLDPKKFIPDEDFSNHAVQGFSHPDCPIKKGCFGIATGFGGVPVRICEYCKSTDTTAECEQDDYVIEG